MGQPFSENISSYDGYNGLYHINDKEYNVRTVTDGRGYACEVNAYYPYGALMNTLTGNGTVQPYKYGGKELDRTAGLDLYDSQARFYDPVLGRTTTVDPKSAAYAGMSHYGWCAGNPTRYVDPTGRDTINVVHNDGIWSIESVAFSTGNDIINVADNLSSIYTEGKYGERVIALNLENNANYTIGILHVSGTNATFLYVTPGGTSSNEVGSNKRIDDGTYPIEAPGESAKWQKPGLGGSVTMRGTRFHYGKANLRKWTAGCFVLMQEYQVKGEQVLEPGNVNMTSQKCSDAFDEALGSSRHFRYSIGDKKRRGSEFPNGIKKLFILRSTPFK